MELENELFLATIEWTWECCLKQKESDNCVRRSAKSARPAKLSSGSA